MNQETLLFTLAFLTPLALALALTPLSMRLASSWDLVDRPGARKSQKKPVPYLGGVALFTAVTLGLLALGWLARNTALEGMSWKCLLACLIPALLGVGLGLWDDLKNLRARHKFTLQVLVALAFTVFAYRFQILHVPGFRPILLDPAVSITLSVFFILALVNGCNMIDGSDGLCAGSSVATLIVFTVIAANYAQPHLMVLSLAGSGAILGFLYWNRPPARIYLGDAGSQGLGFLLACLLLALGSTTEPGQFDGVNIRSPFHYKIVVAVLLGGYASAEVLLSVLRRGLQGRSLVRADQGHLHHRMLRLGLSPGFIVLLAITVNLLCGEIVLTFLDGQKGLTTLLSLVLVTLLVLALQQLGYTRLLQRRWIDARRPHFAVAQHYMAMQNVKLTLAKNMDEVFLLISQAAAELGVEQVSVDLRDSKSKKTGHHWSWSRSAELGQSPAAAPGPTDSHQLNNARGHASWNFEDGGGSEPELEMEMRVLMSEFMHHAVERMHGFLTSAPTVTETALKMELGMSIKGLKGRL
jgi:UDP-GlcNAc:undecaprenyl-phosphate GlcNAc-1-phosphate transferase